MRKRIFLYLTPFVLTAYPPLYLLSINVEVVNLSDIFLSLLLYEILAFVILLAFRMMFKTDEKSVFLTCVVIGIFFAYGHVFALIDAPWGHWLLIPLCLSIIGWSMQLTRRRPFWLPGIISYMSVTSGGLVLVALGSVFYYSLTISSARAISLETILGLDTPDLSVIDPELLNYDIPLHIENRATMPDIYYIILDEYANNHTLMDLHGFDNQPFLDALRERGFFVAEDSRANYPATFLSLASSLNMDYVNFLSGYGNDFSIPYHLIDYNRVVGILRNAGYEIIYFPSIYYVTNGMENADMIYEMERELPALGIEYSNFDLTLFDSTLLGSLIDDNSEEYDILNDYRDVTVYALENLVQIPVMVEPTFTFVHLTVPHRPYVFTADDAVNLPEVDGQVITEGLYAPYTAESEIGAYLDQINFANRSIIDLIDNLLANSSVPPLIIIQSDHGNRMQGEPGVEDWGPAEIYEYVFPILNSYYLPGYEGQLTTSSDTTPVNTFRLIFDYYFGTNFGFIEERNYYPEGYFSYDFIEVTDGIIREVPPAPGAED